MSFLNPSSLRAAASLWPCRWLSTGRVFFDTAISSSSPDEAPKYLSRCRFMVALEQTKLFFGQVLGLKGFNVLLGVLGQFDPPDLGVYSIRIWEILTIDGLRPKRGRLKFLLKCWNDRLTQGGGER